MVKRLKSTGITTYLHDNFSDRLGRYAIRHLCKSQVLH